MAQGGVGAFIEGFATFFRGLGLIWKRGVRRWAFLPILLNALVYGLLLYALGVFFADVVESVRAALPDWLRWLDALLWLLFGLAAFFLFTFTFLVVGSLLACPFNPLLSRAVERALLQGNGIPREERGEETNLASLLLGLPRTVWQEGRKLLYFLGWTVLLFLLFLIPGVNLVAPFAWAFFSAWMCTLDACDYPMENHHVPFVEMRRRLRRNLPQTMGFGTAMLLLLAVPILNLLALPAGVAGATVLYLERFQAEEVG